jgi:hypothetical protein
MPYFYSASWRFVRNRTNVYKKKTESTICPDGKNATHSLQLPLTLDEYCNPSLSDAVLFKRNKDQVVVREALRYREQRKRKTRTPTQSPVIPKAPKKIEMTTRLLMVHQLWLYRFENIHIMSFPEVSLRQSMIMDTLKKIFPSSKSFDDTPVPSTLDITSMTCIASWLYSFIYLFELPIGFDKPVLDIFEESTAVISNDVDEYFNRKSPKEQEKAANDEKEFFHNIADVRGELSMLRAVVTQQEQVWTTFKVRLLSLVDHLDTELGFAHTKDAHALASSAPQVPDKVVTNSGPSPQKQGNTPTSSNSQAPGKAEENASQQIPGKTETSSSPSSTLPSQGKAEPVDVPRALQMYMEDRASAIGMMQETSSLLQRLKDRIDKIDQDAERVQNLVPQYLELKRSYASIKEANYTATLGAAVFGLSLVTIIFTPLSFAAALLALPSDGIYLNTTADTHTKRTITRYTGKIAYRRKWLLTDDSSCCRVPHSDSNGPFGSSSCVVVQE